MKKKSTQSLLSPANRTFLRPWAQTYDQSTAGEWITDCQLGHFHWGLSTGILPAVCQRLRACTRWAHTPLSRHALVLPICHRMQQFAHWHSSTPVGHTSGLGPKPFHPSRNISERQEPVSKWSNAYLMHATGVMSSPLAKERGCL